MENQRAMRLKQEKEMLLKKKIEAKKEMERQKQQLQGRFQNMQSKGALDVRQNY